ncbi:hypothetical protein D9611_009804 [Ephemerocybe angulata]|uniref:Uncharacterized protein n=1 Tax=Ephemerocybe angulata TaxID=980116 RepID=A0A8H5FJR4_9AGAR|nr:hypothetical protein D9611_009804 [Tulosesus angulatus]
MRIAKPSEQDLAQMSLSDKVAFNAKIQARNLKRAMGRPLKAKGAEIPSYLTSGEPDGFTATSDEESALDLEPPAQEKDKDDDDIGSYTPGTMRKFMAFAGKLLSKRTRSDDAESSASKKSKMVTRPAVKETLIGVGESLPLLPPEDYNLIWHSREHVPISLFTRDSIVLCHSKGNSLKSIKGYVGDDNKKSPLINPEDPRFPAEDTLEFHVWAGAAELMAQWANTLDVDGIVGAWMRQHLSWCNLKITREGEDWDLIRSFDIAQRKEYHIRPFVFSTRSHRDRLLDHERTLNKEKAAAAAAAAAASASSSRGGGGGGGGRQGGSSSNSRSFREGQPSKSASTCLVCGNKGHRSDACHAQTLRGGGALFAKVIDGKIVTIAGSKPICGAWNISDITSTHPDILNRICTPYDADAFDTIFDSYPHLREENPHLTEKLRHGFPMGVFPHLSETTIYPNNPSAEEHLDFIDEYFAEEVEARRMSGPYTKEEVEAILGGSFQCHPLSIDEKEIEGSFELKPRMCINLSNGTKSRPSANSYADKEEFPTHYDPASHVGDLVSSRIPQFPFPPLYSRLLAALGAFLWASRPGCIPKASACAARTTRFVRGLRAIRVEYPVLLHIVMDAGAASLPFTRRRTAVLTLSSSRQVAVSPPGTRVMVVDVSKFHRRSPIAPAHKRWFVMQGRKGQLYIQHCCPFGATASESNSGQVSKAVLGIWRAKGIGPNGKWSDDIYNFNYPASGSGSVKDPYVYPYDENDVLSAVAATGMPFHPFTKKGQPFDTTFDYVGMVWDLSAKTVGVREEKRRKFLFRSEVFLDAAENGVVTEEECMKIHGSLCHLAFVYRLGRSHLSSLSSFISRFNDYPHGTSLHAPPSLVTDMRWWAAQLSKPGFTRMLLPLGEVLDLGISVDASTVWGVGLKWGEEWDAWKVKEGWKGPWRDIGWLECLAIELLVLHVEARGHHDCRIRLLSDNQGIIGAYWKGRSRNAETTRLTPSRAENWARRTCSFTLRFRSLRSSDLLLFMFSFSHSYYAAEVSVASKEEEQRKRALARRASESAPPRTSLAHSLSVSSLVSSSSALSPLQNRSLSSPSDPSYDTQSATNHNLPSTVSSIGDVITSRPSVGRVVKARRPRLAKDSHYVKSNLRPESTPAHLRIAHWITPWSLRQLDEMRRELPPASIRKINEVLIQSWCQDTRSTQGAALLRFTEHCDELGIPEEDRMPASPYLLASFVSKHAGRVSESCVDGWMSSLHAWHTVNNAPWKGDSSYVSQVKKGAAKLAPPPKPPRMPVTLQYMKVLQQGLDLFDPFDAAVWAVGTCAFWGCCRLGELTVEFDSFVDPKFSVLRSFANVSFGSSSSSAPIPGQTVSFRIPWTKTTHGDGAVLTISGEESLSPFHAMKNHLAISKAAPPDSHLFSYQDTKGCWHPMTKARFMTRCNEIWVAAGLDPLDGHAFRIGGSTELLLGGVPPHVVAMVGRWKSLTFLKYWRNVSEIIVNSIASCYDKSRIVAVTKAMDAFCSSK